MDPITHTLTGAALSRAGLHRATPLATATLVFAANVPDIDIAAYAGGSYTALALRRGLTHGPLALLLLALVVAGAVLLYDRAWRRRRNGGLEPARAGPILLLALAAAATHAPLDWMNTYGVRLLSPFSGRWFYGDALFIIDPWIWLALAAVVAVHTMSRRGWIAWFLLAMGASMLISGAPQVATGAKLAWGAGLAAVALYVILRRRLAASPRSEVHARVALLLVVLYIAGMVAADGAARRHVVAAAAAAGYEVQDLMVAPVPANPFAGDVVLSSGNYYRLGSFSWLTAPRVQWAQEPIRMGMLNEAALATMQLPEVRDFLRWSRYPFVETGTDEEGRYVRWGDARYPERMGGGLSGVTVRVETQPAPE